MSTSHWDAVWNDRHPDKVTWFQAESTTSLQLIQAAAGPGAGVIDVGGGASRLIDQLLAAGYCDVTVLDIAAASIASAQQRLGSDSDRVKWIVADATAALFGRTFDIWHDRAAFHFLIDADDRARYLVTMKSALAIGGHVVMSTFGPDGPEMCSGLPVRRYGIELMSETLGDTFEPIGSKVEQHITPSGAMQQFVYGVFRRLS